MHIIEGKGALAGLLRATKEGVPRRKSHLAIYEDSIPGEADYQIYDRRVTAQALDWLKSHHDDDEPWLLVVSYASPHPPFKVPQRFWDMYPLDDVPMPVKWRKSDWPTHPAEQYLAWMNSLEDDFEEDFVRRVVAGYCGLITHTDEQIGQVMDAVQSLGIADSTRIVYTSDHGEAAGHHGILGKSNLYEHSIGVPLIMAGPGLPSAKEVQTPVSHVDLFPTIVESMGVAQHEEDADLPGNSLWSMLDSNDTSRPVFAEFHANGSLNAGFTLRRDNYKLNYHVGMPRQLFDLSEDPQEQQDLAASDLETAVADALEQQLRAMLDPEAVEDRCKSDQLQHMEKFGGVEAVRKEGVFSRSPIPGKRVDMESVAQ